jgi:hypothetical protein
MYLALATLFIQTPLTCIVPTNISLLDFVDRHGKITLERKGNMSTVEGIDFETLKHINPYVLGGKSTIEQVYPQKWRLVKLREFK